MIKLYEEAGYPEKPQEVKGKSIVDVLTSEEHSEVRRAKYDANWRKTTTEFGINYGSRKGDRAPFLRGFQHIGVHYEIDVASKLLLIQSESGQLFYDSDKIERNHFVIEASIDDVLDEFKHAGYTVEMKEE